MSDHHNRHHRGHSSGHHGHDDHHDNHHDEHHGHHYNHQTTMEVSEVNLTEIIIMVTMEVITGIIEAATYTLSL